MLCAYRQVKCLWNLGVQLRNPTTTRGADYAQHITASPPGFENPAASLGRPCVVGFCPLSVIESKIPRILKIEFTKKPKFFVLKHVYVTFIIKI